MLVPVCFPVSSHCLLPLVLQEQKCTPASGELSPDLQEWAPYSPGHSSRHSNPPFYPSRASVGELAGQGWGGGSTWAHKATRPQGEWRRSFQGAAACPQQNSPKGLAVADLPGVFRLVSVTFFSFSERFLPMAVWEIGSTEESSPAI